MSHDHFNSVKLPNHIATYVMCVGIMCHCVQDMYAIYTSIYVGILVFVRSFLAVSPHLSVKK